MSMFSTQIVEIVDVPIASEINKNHYKHDKDKKKKEYIQK
jgi:hypothetical protein